MSDNNINNADSQPDRQSLAVELADLRYSLTVMQAAMEKALKFREAVRLEFLEVEAARDLFRKALELDEAIFRSYAEMHAAKGTSEGAKKSEANMEHARRIRALLDSNPQ